MQVPESVLEGILGWFYFTELYRPWKVGQFRFFLTHEIHSEINDKYIGESHTNFHSENTEYHYFAHALVCLRSREMK